MAVALGAGGIGVCVAGAGAARVGVQVGVSVGALVGARVSVLEGVGVDWGSVCAVQPAKILMAASFRKSRRETAFLGLIS